MQNRRTRGQRIGTLVTGFLFILAGANHFIMPKPYIAMIPHYLPDPGLLVRLSGVAEILGGCGVLFPKFRKFAGWGLIALLFAVFPANLHVAIYGWPGHEIASWILWARLPLQLAFIWSVYFFCLCEAPGNKNARNR